MIDLNIYADGAEPRQITIAEDATVEQLATAMRGVGASIGESGDNITLWVEDDQVICRKPQRLHEFGIRHGNRLHGHPRVVLIIVNTREKKWDKPEISYEDVVVLAFGKYDPDPNVVYTITYSKGPEHHRQGSLIKGQAVKVKTGMIFNVTRTNKS
jgi:Multiubiquitin